jgi:hypothetical protein
MSFINWFTLISGGISLFFAFYGYFEVRKQKRVLAWTFGTLAAFFLLTAVLSVTIPLTSATNTTTQSNSTSTPTSETNSTTTTTPIQTPVISILTSGCQRNDPPYLTVTIKNIVKTSDTEISIDFVFNNASDTALHLNFSNITIIATDSNSKVAFRDHDLPAVDILAHGSTELPLSFSGFDNSHTHRYTFASQIRNNVQWACDFIPIQFTVMA